TFLETVFGSLDNVEIKKDQEPEPTPEPTPTSDDPFDGIKDDDIATYSDLFDVPPPERDSEALKLGNKIRQWIKDGRPKPGESNDDKDNQDDKDEQDDTDGDIQKHDKEEKSKKKRGMFGFFKK
ncbi:MAG: signal recognition particle-docking protein FtsY, partial [Nitrosopumilus sp.]|nr:signal recognition particle-docking protein FtsY [Nitrosopumilus sp.]